MCSDVEGRDVWVVVREFVDINDSHTVDDSLTKLLCRVGGLWSP
jgi:hypothetical protein